MMKLVAGISAIIVMLGLFFGVYRYIDTRYALAVEAQKEHGRLDKQQQMLEKRLDYKIMDDQRFSVQKEMREIEERNLGKKIESWDKRDRDRYKDLQEQLEKVRDKLKNLQ